MDARARVAVIGAAGRMGRLVVTALEEAPDFEVALRVERRLAPLGAEEDVAARVSPVLEQATPGSIDAVAEFTVSRAVPAIAAEVRRLRCAWLSGTTGLEEAGHAALTEAARTGPVLWAPNFSLGVALLRRFVRQAAALLPTAWEMELVEIHHGAKVDAPSGTALALASDWRERRGGEEIHGRSGRVGARARGEVGLHAVRLPEGVGEHRVLLGGDGELLELTHRATERASFARGAVEALRWLVGQPAGLYTTEDWLADVLRK